MWATTKGLNDYILKYNAKELSNHFSRFFAEIRKSDGSKYEPDTLRVMLAVLDKHLRQNESKISIAKTENLWYPDKSWREKQEFFVRKATENDQIQHSKMKSSYGRTKYWETTIQNRSFIPCDICSPFILAFAVSKSTMECLSKILT